MSTSRAGFAVILDAKSEIKDSYDVGAGAAGPGLEYRTLQDLTTERIRSASLSGRLGPGARLHRDTLARQFGVSRMPVREALRALQSEGLVERRPHRGAAVVNLDPDDVAGIFEIRALLEARAAELAAPHLTDAHLAGMRASLAEMEQCEGDEERWHGLNTRFHTTIYPASGWPHLCALIAAQRNVVQPYLRLATAVLGRAASARGEHAAILRAAEDRDGPRLAQLTVDHLRNTAAGVVAEIARHRRDGHRPV